VTRRHDVVDEVTIPGLPGTMPEVPLWCPVPYRTVNLVDTRAVHHRDLLPSGRRRSSKGSRMPRFSIGSRLLPRWMLLVAVFVNVSAQGNSDSIGCRIKIDDVLKDTRTANTLNAFTYCLDKSG
jgi:hypothetical protein